MSQLTSQLLKIAIAEIGTREIGSSNRGRKVDEYQKADNLAGEGYAWCSSFVSWLIRETANAHGIKIPWSFSPSCDKVWEDARLRGLVRFTPQPGDFFLVRARLKNGKFSDRDAIHIGVVKSVAADGKTFTTIEGNSNDEGLREGYEVASIPRPVSERFVFVRWSDGVKNFANLTAQVEAKPETWQVVLKHGANSKTLEGVAFDGRPYISARDFGTFFGLPVEWRRHDLQTVIEGVEVPFQVRFWRKRAFYPARVLAEMKGFVVIVDGAKKRVEVAG